MVQKKQRRKKKKSAVTRTPSNGFENLIGMHTEALEENSAMISLMLQEILNKSKASPLNPIEQNMLKKFKRELSALDDDLESLGDQ